MLMDSLRGADVRWIEEEKLGASKTEWTRFIVLPCLSNGYLICKSESLRMQRYIETNHIILDFPYRIS